MHLGINPSSKLSTHPVPEFLLEQMFLGIPVMKISECALLHGVGYVDGPLHIMSLAALLCDFSKSTLRISSLCFSALVTALKESCPQVHLWKDSSKLN